MNSKLFGTLMIVLTILGLASCSPATEPSEIDHSLIYCWEDFVPDGKAIILSPSLANPKDFQQVVIDPGNAKFVGLVTGKQLVGIVLGSDILFEVSNLEKVTVVQLPNCQYSGTSWLEITVPEGESASLRFSR